MLNLDGAKERLHLFEANLLEQDSFDAAIHGCLGVFHTASPVKFDVANPQVNHLKPFFCYSNAIKCLLNLGIGSRYTT